MKLPISLISLSSIIIALIVTTSCRIETARPSSEKQLFIASDYLEEKDSSLFQVFVKKMNTRVTIVPMSTDKIIGTIRNKGTNSEIDLIMVKSLYNVYKLDKRSILHSIDLEDELPAEITSISSWKYNFVGFGIDPFVIAYNPETGSVVKTYNDLTRYKFINALNKDELIPMLSPVMRKMRKVHANKWIQRYMDKSIFLDSLNDSISKGKSILTTFSGFHDRVQSDSLYMGKSLLFPNKRSSGTFFTTRTFCIVDQAQNYSEAKALILFYSEPKNNQSINRKLNTVSLFTEVGKFRKYSVEAEKLFTYYGIVDRVVIKLNIR